MNFLLDTHVWIWLVANPNKLGIQSSQIFKEVQNQFFLSPVSILEIAQLNYRGRLNFRFVLNIWLQKAHKFSRAATQDITHEIALESYLLPEPFHSDPADRILVATARLHEMTLITADERILAYPNVKTSDARQ